MNHRRSGCQGPGLSQIGEKSQCFLRVGGGGDGWEQQKTFQETQRDNLLIHGRLLQCMMCSDVHTRVHGCECLHVCCPPLLHLRSSSPSSFTHHSFYCVSDPNPLCPSSPFLSISSHTQRIKIRFFVLISGSSPRRRFVLPPRSDER